MICQELSVQLMMSPYMEEMSRNMKQDLQHFFNDAKNAEYSLTETSLSGRLQK